MYKLLSTIKSKNRILNIQKSFLKRFFCQNSELDKTLIPEVLKQSDFLNPYHSPSVRKDDMDAILKVLNYDSLQGLLNDAVPEQVFDKTNTDFRNDETFPKATAQNDLLSELHRTFDKNI